MPSGKLKKISVVLGLLVVALLLAGGILIFQLTRDIEPEWRQGPNRLEAHEAKRKLKLLATAQADGTRGFVRLSEVEVNSLLDEQFAQSKSNSVALPPELMRTGVVFSRTNLSFYCWEQRKLGGVPLSLAWERIIVPRRESGKWEFPITEMHVGALKLPPRFWRVANGFLGGVDAIFEERRNWLARLPWIELSRNEANDGMELKLYTYIPAGKQ